MVEIRVNVEQDVNFSVLLHGSTVQKEAAIEFSCQAVLVLKSHQGANPSILSCFAYQGVGNPQPMLSVFWAFSEYLYSVIRKGRLKPI